MQAGGRCARCGQSNLCGACMFLAGSTGLKVGFGGVQEGGGQNEVSSISPTLWPQGSMGCLKPAVHSEWTGYQVCSAWAGHDRGCTHPTPPHHLRTGAAAAGNPVGARAGSLELGGAGDGQGVGVCFGRKHRCCCQQCCGCWGSGGNVRYGVGGGRGVGACFARALHHPADCT